MKSDPAPTFLFDGAEHTRTPILPDASLYLADEASSVRNLLARLRTRSDAQQEISRRAHEIVRRVRAKTDKQSTLDAFMQEYDLSSEEGITLMCLAESLLRIPDPDTMERLIQDKLGDANWASHIGRSKSIFVNASTWGLMLTGKLVATDAQPKRDFRSAFGKLISKSGEPVIRLAIRQAMKIMGFQFVMGRSIDEALKRASKNSNAAYRYSFDMLGEAALTARDAQSYFESYEKAIIAMGQRGPFSDVFSAPSISVKLSALHPRYEHPKRERVMRELCPRLLALAVSARNQGIGLTVDAEESERLELSLQVFVAVFRSAELAGWQGLGLAVQAYQKRAPAVLTLLRRLAKDSGRMIPIRLVKGAYWDSEIKHCQQLGLAGYPVFTRKASTDVSYLCCALSLLEARHLFYPQFATHNAHTIASILEYAGDYVGFEFQRLHGMGKLLYSEVLPQVPCRVYAPVGSHEDLLPYLVRRLLENGANTSFVNRIVDEKQAIADVIRDPVEQTSNAEPLAHPLISLPADIFLPQRVASAGLNLCDELELARLKSSMQEAVKATFVARPLVAGASTEDLARLAVRNPANTAEIVGHWQAADEATVELALVHAEQAYPEWDALPTKDRAQCLLRAADMLEERSALFAGLCVLEAGKTINDAIAEIREAVDFCRYYAAQAMEKLAPVITLPGPTGETSQLFAHGRGIFVCVSPWNFPLAIFIGQVSAALVSGNTVIAKPAEQTNLIAFEATRLLHQSGVPEAVLQLLPGEGASVGQQLCADPRVSGVAFTGSTETARTINQTLAARPGAIATFIAETGGQNCMLVDSSALPEQVVKDVIESAFGSAGQRCSALRVLYIQEDIADKTMEMLAGAMAELSLGNPGLIATDLGPVIDQDAYNDLQAHIDNLQRSARLIYACELPLSCNQGYFIAPHAFEISSIDRLQKENFGPILHVIRYKSNELSQVVKQITATGYGLTMGIHSRIESSYREIGLSARVGNCYINRNMVGAVVGVHPFGGEGLSGTGPKAGGPNYLSRFISERTLTINTTAVGGNASLLSLSD